MEMSLLLFLRVLGVMMANVLFTASMVVLSVPAAEYFEMQGVKRWKAYIPFYNEYIFLTIHGMKGWFWGLMPLLIIGATAGHLLMVTQMGMNRAQVQWIVSGVVTAVALIILVLNMKSTGLFLELREQLKTKKEKTNKLLDKIFEAISPILTTEMTLVKIVYIAVVICTTVTNVQ